MSGTFEEAEVLTRRRRHIDPLWVERGCLDGETAQERRRRHLARADVPHCQSGHGGGRVVFFQIRKPPDGKYRVAAALCSYRRNASPASTDGFQSWSCPHPARIILINDLRANLALSVSLYMIAGQPPSSMHRWSGVFFFFLPG